MKRLQRLRHSKNLRDMTAETEFNTAQLIQPLFVAEGLKSDEDIKGLKDIKRHSSQTVLSQVGSDVKAGVRHFILFQVPAQKAEKNFSVKFVGEVIKNIKREFGDHITLWVDTCLCSLTTHGHCCVIGQGGNQDLSATLSEIGTIARAYGEAGADGISPSDMNDGRVAEIRRVLDGAQLGHVPIMSYSTKFQSQFYGPFRNAADSAPQFGDRSQYQIDVRNRSDAIHSSVRCAQEGADLLMVKPGLTSLDLIYPIYKKTGIPVGAYHTSGEYAWLTTLADQGFLHFDKALVETFHVFKRAGAQFIITYAARLGQKLGVKTP